MASSKPPAPTAPDYVHKAHEKLLLAEARKTVAEAREAEDTAVISQLLRQRALREESERLAQDKYHNIYRFTSSVDPKSVSFAEAQIDAWTRGHPEASVELIFTSPGGDVIAGLAFWDYLQTIRDQGNKITTVAQGMAASMAGILLQAGDTRVMGKESYLLIHQISAGVMGSFGEIEDRVKWFEKVQNRILDIFATRAAETTGKDFTRTRRYFEKNWQRTDWWLDSKEAKELGVVDEIR